MKELDDMGGAWGKGGKNCLGTLQVARKLCVKSEGSRGIRMRAGMHTFRTWAAGEVTYMSTMIKRTQSHLLHHGATLQTCIILIALRAPAYPCCPEAARSGL